MVLRTTTSAGINLFDKKYITGLIIFLLILISLLSPSQNLLISDLTVSGELGAPPVNGTTSASWVIEASDNIFRANENISTKDIVIQTNGKMEWYNITAVVNGLFDVQNNGIFRLLESDIKFMNGLNCTGDINFESVIGQINQTTYVRTNGKLNIINSTLVLTGDLIVKGKLNLINSTLIINCSTQAQYFISNEIGGEFICLSGSVISGISKDLAVRIIYISPNSKFRAEDSEFNYIGYNTKFAGIKTEAGDTIIKNCSFSNCYYALNLVNCQDNIIEDCLFDNNIIGINLSITQNNLISNCSFKNNKIDISSYSSGFNKFTNFRSNSSKIGFFVNMSDNNIIDTSSFENLENAVILIHNSNNNSIHGCLVQNASENGLYINHNTSYITITNTTFRNNQENLVLINNSKYNRMINCTLDATQDLDISLNNGSELWTLNTTFNKTLVSVGAESNLTVQWFLHIFTQNSTLVPLPFTNVSMTDNANGTFELITKTGGDAKIEWITVTEYFQTTQQTVNLTPHKIIAEKFGYENKVINVTMDRTQMLMITMNEILLFAPDLVPMELTFSNDFPLQGQNITISAMVKNMGYEEFNNSGINVTVDFYSDGLLINRTLNISSIPIGGYLEFKFNWTVTLTNGSHIITIAVDPDNNLTEVNNLNNNRSKTLVVNTIPIAILNITPTQALTFERITLNASKSYNENPGMTIVEYWFHFGDGTYTGWIAQNTVYHNYTNDGEYTVGLRVRDNSGLTSALTEQVILINNRPPLANFTITPDSGRVNTEFTFDPGLSSDLDGSIVQYYWEFSDGTNSTEDTPKHMFNDDIEYQVTLTIWDNDNAKSASVIKKIKILNTPPVARFTASKVKANTSENIIFDAKSSYDIDDEQSILEFTWDFGDDTYGFNDSLISHNYSKPGLYTVSVFVKDDDGNTDIERLEINITTQVKTKPGTDDNDFLFWVMVLIVIIIIIFFLIIIQLFVSHSKKLHRLADEEGEVPEFTTAGKLDFVILKKTFIRRFLKFEVYKTVDSPKEYVGMLWKSALLDSSWQMQESVLDSKEKVVDYLQMKILALINKGWSIDYPGNNLILPKEYTKKPALGVKLTKPTNTMKNESSVEDPDKPESEPTNNMAEDELKKDSQ